jgi:antitoxin FitA
MRCVQIKNVPERTHAVLRHRGAAAHQSLQEYLRARLSAASHSDLLLESIVEDCAEGSIVERKHPHL